MITFTQKRFIFLSLNRIIHSVETVLKQLVKARGGGGRDNSSSTLVPMLEQENAWKDVFFRQARVRAYSRKGGGGGKISIKQKNRTFSKFRGKIVKRIIFRGLWHQIQNNLKFQSFHLKKDFEKEMESSVFFFLNKYCFNHSSWKLAIAPKSQNPRNWVLFEHSAKSRAFLEIPRKSRATQ